MSSRIAPRKSHLPLQRGFPLRHPPAHALPFAALAALSLATAAAPSRGAPPNIVLIVADDLGYSDVGFAMDYSMVLRTEPHNGAPWDPAPLAEVSTPNIDRLAQQSVVFTNGYVNGSVCSPTRAALMLGRYQHRVRVYDAGDGGSGTPIFDTPNYSLDNNTFARVNPVFPEFLKQSPVTGNRYVAGVFGKWHLGEDDIYNFADGALIDSNGRAISIPTPYQPIGGNYEEPNIAGPIANILPGQQVDPSWIGGSPWHCLNRGFDQFFYFMGKGSHDYWDPNEIYDSGDPSHPFRRTVGLPPRRDPGFSGTDDYAEMPNEAWDHASPYTVHPERVPANYLTVRITNAAGDFIEQHAGGPEPFFCYVPFNAAHSPSQAPFHKDPWTSQLDPIGTDTRRHHVLDASGNPIAPVTEAIEADWANPKTPDPNWFPDPIYLYEKYKDDPRAFRYFSGGTGLNGGPLGAPAGSNRDNDLRTRCVTLAMVRWMDKGIGQILERLKDPNQDGDTSDSVYDNTVVIFISDNGGASGMRAANAPLRGNKSTNFEGGIRSPFLFSWPQMLKAQNGVQTNDHGETVAQNQYVDAPVIAMDLLPTILDINSLDPLPDNPLLNAETRDFYDYTPDGKSLMPLIRGDVSSIHEYLFWAQTDSPYADGVVRKGPWKLRYLADASVELYNLDTHIGETVNVATENPAIVRELRQAYFQFMSAAAYSAREPVPNPRVYAVNGILPGPPAQEDFNYPVGALFGASLREGGTGWAGAWQVTDPGNADFLTPGLTYNDPSGYYIDDSDSGQRLAAHRKQTEIFRTFSGSAVTTPVWFSCLVGNMDEDTEETHRWEIHPGNDANTYLRLGEGVTAVTRFVAKGAEIPLTVPVSLGVGTHLVVMRMETNVSAARDSVKVWILPAGTAIGGYSEADLNAAAGGVPNLSLSDRDLWGDGLDSIGLIGDGQNQEANSAWIDAVRVSFQGTSDVQRIEELMTGLSTGPGMFSNLFAVRIHSFAPSDGSTVRLEYDERGGWLAEGIASGAMFEQSTTLQPGSWSPITPDELQLLDWYGDSKAYAGEFTLDSGEEKVFLRIRYTPPPGL